MAKLAWTLLPVALAAGVAGGYFVRGEQTKTQIQTVVQIQTVAAPPPATHLLTAEVRGPNGACLTTDNNVYPDVMRHTFSLRRPGNGNSEGDVVAVAQNLAIAACDLEVEFKISPKLGFFMVGDEQESGQWGPFDSHQMAARNWTLLLDESS